VEAGFPSRHQRNAFARRSCSNKENRDVSDAAIGARVDVSIDRRDQISDRRDGKRASESSIAIRPKSSFRHASARPQRGNRENFFVAKPYDSESVHTSF
jgi:hypothetical protein